MTICFFTPAGQCRRIRWLHAGGCAAEHGGQRRQRRLLLSVGECDRTQSQSTAARPHQGSCLLDQTALQQAAMARATSLAALLLCWGLLAAQFCSAAANGDEEAVMVRQSHKLRVSPALKDAVGPAMQ